jgi:hypothetical protein
VYASLVLLFDSIPLEFGLMEQLSTLILIGNPTRMLPFSELRAGTEHIKQRLRNKIPEDSPLWSKDGTEDDVKATADTAHTDEQDDAITQLQAEIEELALAMEEPTLSAPRKYAMKKKLQMSRAKLIRAERARASKA